MSNEVWASSTRGDLMSEDCARSGTLSRQTLVHVACDIAALALPRVTGGETRPATAINTARAWANNPASTTRGQLAAAAQGAAFAAGQGASGAAARAAAFACYVAIDALASDRGVDAGVRALAVADAAAAAEGTSGRNASLAAAANAVRARVPTDPR